MIIKVRKTLKRVAIAFISLFVVLHIAKGAEVTSADNFFSENSEVQLNIVGYNYTDREIDHYSVDGKSGGSIGLSSPSSGGSGITCCVRIKGAIGRNTKLRVRWQVDGCRYIVTNSLTGRTETLRHLFYKEVEVPVFRKTKNQVFYLETHFYPDGAVRVQVTEEPSLPHLLLSERRNEKSSFPRCKDDKKPE